MNVTIGVEGGGVLKRQGFWQRLFHRQPKAVIVLHGGAMPESLVALSPLDEEVRNMLDSATPLRVRVPPGEYPSFRAAYARGELVAKFIDRSTDPPTIVFESTK